MCSVNCGVCLWAACNAVNTVIEEDVLVLKDVYNQQTKFHGALSLMVRTFTCSFAVACSEDYLLQFPTRYLEWIMIAREVSLDPTFSLSSGARADALTEAERNTILSVRRM